MAELKKLPGMQHRNLDLENMEERLRNKTKFCEKFQHASNSFLGKINRKRSEKIFEEIMTKKFVEHGCCKKRVTTLNRHTKS